MTHLDIDELQVNLFNKGLILNISYSEGYYSVELTDKKDNVMKIGNRY